MIAENDPAAVPVLSKIEVIQFVPSTDASIVRAAVVHCPASGRYESGDSAVVAVKRTGYASARWNCCVDNKSLCHDFDLFG